MYHVTSLLVGGATWLAEKKWRSALCPGRWSTWLTSWPGRWITWPASWLGRKDAIGWLDMTSKVAFFLAGRPGDALKGRKAWTSTLWRFVDEIPSSFRDKTSELAIHNPHYRQQSRVHKGGTDITVDVRSNFLLFWWNSFFVDVHIYELTGRLMLYSKDVWTSALWRNLKNASLAADVHIYKLTGRLML